ncbi:MAG: pyridine nucleotide-disulfide oxidoreductase [Gammaproteobacteria bacterium]|nr:MAG: pyridine nucleotide-disulfide oxidoreductase [Gammaproteobacteria bacterium]
MNNANPKHCQIVIAGGGTAGISVAAALKSARPGLQISLIEPSHQHYYQPAWTLVGGGIMTQQQTEREQAPLIPKGVEWIRDRVTAFDPGNNQLTLETGGTLKYQSLVVALGLQLDWGVVEGLKQTLGKNGVTSNYSFDLTPYTWECVNNFKGGRALFTQPPMPIKCAGAPQKILYLAADHWRRNGVSAESHFFTQGGAMFGVPFYAKALDNVIAGYGATPHFGMNLTAVDGASQMATFTDEDGNTFTEQFDFLHVTPPQSAPDVIKQSALAGASGWVEVNRNSLQHKRYDNVFALGDCTDTPNAKTAAAVRRQFPVVVTNLLATLDQNNAATTNYDGYGGCPLTTEKGKIMLAEFRYDGEVVSSFNLDPRVPRRFYWWMKEHFFPFLYWHVILKGKDWRKPEARPRPDLIKE